MHTPTSGPFVSAVTPPEIRLLHSSLSLGFCLNVTLSERPSLTTFKEHSRHLLPLTSTLPSLVFFVFSPISDELFICLPLSPTRINAPWKQTVFWFLLYPYYLRRVCEKIAADPLSECTEHTLFCFKGKFSSIQLLSCVWLFEIPWTAARQASLSITNPRSLPKLMSIESVMPSNHLILCRPLLLLPAISSSIRAFSNESTLCIRWPKYWSFSFNISPSNEHPGLISYRMDWLDLLAV